jgi:hypothetical protein
MRKNDSEKQGDKMSANRSFSSVAPLALIVAVFVASAAFAGPATVAAKEPSGEPTVSLLTSGLAGASGSTIGPGGALYVTEGTVGKITRVDPQTGDKTTFAEGLPPAIFPIGGANDLVFIGETAYVLVTMVGPDIGGSNVVGIYRVDGPNSFTVIADIGQWSIDNPSGSDVFIQSGVHYAIETFRGGFLVTDGHHNRVLHVTRDGDVSEMMAFDNTVPTGLEVHGNTVYMAEAGPVPHLPEDGRVMAFGPRSENATEVASGAPLLVDVEYGRGRTLYALAQGDWSGMFGGEGSPADPNTGKLVEVNGDGSFTVVADYLNQPTSVEFIGNTAYVVTLGGEIFRIDNVSDPPFGVSR